ncbi:PfkB family carbohydrate kinase [Dehalococcoidia bacterium]|nr:PfkB family carbohydrate kinase [Dehalococcoidia bacterium]
MNINNKLLEVSKLNEEMRHIRNDGRKIVHCHGVFDLLHIGHIRHFEQAKSLGDVLVVTITPDRFVNKGPHRPAFTENLRAEAVASLDHVDYVSVNSTENAVHPISEIRPDFYVKGSDYKDSSKDITGGISEEESAVNSVGGEIVFTEDITFSSSQLINRFIPDFPKETVQYLEQFSQRFSVEQIDGIIEEISKLKVLVIGEAIIDEYQYCDAIGKSSKEPMLAVRHISQERFAGGVLAIANHIASFAERVEVLTFVGAEDSEEKFIRNSLASNVTPTLLTKQGTPTIVKKRIIDKYFFTKLLEIYQMDDRQLNIDETRELCDYLKENVRQYDVVIVADYGHGMFNESAMDVLKEHSKFIALNVQSNAASRGYQTVTRYPRANYVAIDTNEVLLEARDRNRDIRETMIDISSGFGDVPVVVTRGKDGCLCLDPNNGFFSVPAVANDVVDRVGAGDAFLAVTALCMSTDCPIELVGMLGNAVGAQSVSTVGNKSAVDRVALMKQMESLLKY